ncbi:hypothetical protein Pcinc_020461 [Petrolisthes cinctipes]|uniref:Uncharacterized protein n=1 Tax=Petrolisthes cinctipes TaxID=88211 RepID=A0AAE1FJ49_PETCI|nr:hypothetical protein Pcinc_020461 [Petrolisthes cinctipes]
MLRGGGVSRQGERERPSKTNDVEDNRVLTSPTAPAPAAAAPVGKKTGGGCHGNAPAFRRLISMCLRWCEMLLVGKGVF